MEGGYTLEENSAALSEIGIKNLLQKPIDVVYYPQTDSTNTRIIDSNVILQQHLKQDLPQTQTPAQNVQEEEGGFSAGLVTGDPGQVIKAEPQIDYEAKGNGKGG